MKKEMWECIQCGKKIIFIPNNWKNNLSKVCICGGRWKFVKELNEGVKDDGGF